MNEVNKECYFVPPNTGEWSKGKSICDGYSSSVVSIHSQQEQKLLEGNFAIFVILCFTTNLLNLLSIESIIYLHLLLTATYLQICK